MVDSKADSLLNANPRVKDIFLVWSVCSHDFWLLSFLTTMAEFAGSVASSAGLLDIQASLKRTQSKCESSCGAVKTATPRFKTVKSGLFPIVNTPI